MNRWRLQWPYHTLSANQFRSIYIDIPRFPRGSLILTSRGIILLGILLLFPSLDWGLIIIICLPTLYLLIWILLLIAFVIMKFKYMIFSIFCFIFVLLFCKKGFIFLSSSVRTPVFILYFLSHVFIHIIAFFYTSTFSIWFLSTLYLILIIFNLKYI